MIVDDRLETVLRTVAAGPGAIRTQFRQLADLLGRTPDACWIGTHKAALKRMDSLHAALGDAASGALLRTCALRSPILVAHLAGLGPKTALAAITGARLGETEWLQLIPGLPVQARGYLRHRRDLGHAVEALLARFGITDFALPLPLGFEPLVLDPVLNDTPKSDTGIADALAAEPLAPLPPAPPPAPPHLVAVPASVPPSLTRKPAAPQAEGISAIIERIEAFRRARESAAREVRVPEDQATGALLTLAGEAGGQTRLPFTDEPLPLPRIVTSVDIRLDPSGTVITAGAPYAAALVGLRPFAADPDAPVSCDAASLRAVRARQPVTAGLLAIEDAGAIAGMADSRLGGAWQIDAVPLFAPETGHFLGYHARLRRPPAALPAAAAANDDAPGSSADRLRQMLHELRTPINAIQGFAELIQQQLLGPTPHQYRSLAAGIASDAARMLAGFEDIERLAHLEHEPEAGPHDGTSEETDLAALLTRLVGQLDPVLAPREVKLRCEGTTTPLLVAAGPEELERTLWRLLSVMAGAAAPGERLALSLAAHGVVAQLVLPLPAALAMRDDAALMAPDPAAFGAANGGAMLGSGFALRLAVAEIRAMGGTLVRSSARLDITLPLLTAARQALSHAGDPAGQAG
ncbi:MAG: histidine kinase dimerization/phospho-acceptor domain-containing protein [Novosphingobium sp.]